ncbi:polysaccharide deacetylase family protein [Paenibacillus hexagrammi]|uniref:Polysaccharide deacetylase family protein n=1 Tax=Paenibacillus hexagrammi TaxID=2908839 RepID=A0ABY3SCD8_9BACL|nr:polysaccharide deacetylase family protein [Paenibacillus sp. YPD9-1]UJF31649.1 polysaccharide deacetylase family protein [Paenibacillus sp. YPD9-1]
MPKAQETSTANPKSELVRSQISSATTKPTAAPTPAPGMLQPSLSPTPLPTVTPASNSVDVTSVSQTTVQASTYKSKPANAGDRQPLSWYYMKKKPGQVPDFPRDTKSFTADQKAFWVGQGKKVYLTIDAGGPLIDVDLMLKSLKDNDVKANFFISGNNIKKNPDYVKKLVADGHLIANHTMTHRDFNELSDDQIKKEITDFEALYKEITGKDLEKFFRFPYGHYNLHNLSLVSSLGYTSVFWSTAMRDWEPRKNGAEDPYNDIMNNLHDGNVILMHQGSKENMEALDRICKEIKNRGYEFALVNELSSEQK